MNNTNPTSKATVVTSSSNVLSKRGALLNIFVSAASGAPTITIYDDAATGTTTPLVTVFTPVAATNYQFNFDVQNGVHVAIGGTVSCTVGTQSAA